MARAQKSAVVAKNAPLVPFATLELSVPQTRGVEFYPTSLERGERSERALKLAVAEMYVQGVSTRKVQQITQELCGLDVSSSQVSRACDSPGLSDTGGVGIMMTLTEVRNGRTGFTVGSAEAETVCG